MIMDLDLNLAAFSSLDGFCNFCLNIWIGFDNIILNFSANFGSVLGLQITVLKSFVLWSFSNPSQFYIVLV